MKIKRMLAWTGIVVLAGLFITAIVMAVTGAPKNHLMAVIFSMVFIPFILYAMGLVTRLLRPDSQEELRQLGKDEGKDKE